MSDDDCAAKVESLTRVLAERDRYYAALFSELHAKVDVALETIKTEVERNGAAVDRRFESVNEFRQALSDQTHQFLLRAEYITHHDTLVNAIANLEKKQAAQEGKTAGLNAGWVYLGQSIAIVASIVAMLIALRVK